MVKCSSQKLSRVVEKVQKKAKVLQPHFAFFQRYRLNKKYEKKTIALDIEERDKCNSVIEIMDQRRLNSQQHNKEKYTMKKRKLDIYNFNKLA